MAQTFVKRDGAPEGDVTFLLGNADPVVVSDGGEFVIEDDADRHLVAALVDHPFLRVKDSVDEAESVVGDGDVTALVDANRDGEVQMLPGAGREDVKARADAGDEVSQKALDNAPEADAESEALLKRREELLKQRATFREPVTDVADGVKENE